MCFALSLRRSDSCLIGRDLNASSSSPFPPASVPRGEEKAAARSFRPTGTATLYFLLIITFWSFFFFFVQAEPRLWDLFLLLLFYQNLSESRGLALGIIMG